MNNDFRGGMILPCMECGLEGRHTSMCSIGKQFETQDLNRQIGGIRVPLAAEKIAERKTLRDEFAMAALQGMLAESDNYTFTKVSKAAFECADAMMEARK